MTRDLILTLAALTIGGGISLILAAVGACWAAIYMRRRRINRQVRAIGVRPYVLPAWTGDTVDGDQLSVDVRFAAISVAESEGAAR